MWLGIKQRFEPSLLKQIGFRSIWEDFLEEVQL